MGLRKGKTLGKRLTISYLSKNSWWPSKSILKSKDRNYLILKGCWTAGSTQSLKPYRRNMERCCMIKTRSLSKAWEIKGWKKLKKRRRKKVKNRLLQWTKDWEALSQALMLVTWIRIRKLLTPRISCLSRQSGMIQPLRGGRGRIDLMNWINHQSLNLLKTSNWLQERKIWNKGFRRN